MQITDKTKKIGLSN